jgi:hypothetical protein
MEWHRVESRCAREKNEVGRKDDGDGEDDGGSHSPYPQLAVTSSNPAITVNATPVSSFLTPMNECRRGLQARSAHCCGQNMAKPDMNGGLGRGDEVKLLLDARGKLCWR